MVAGLASHEKETTFQDAEARSNRHGVKVFYLEFSNFPSRLSIVIFDHVKRDFEKISIFTLQQEEEGSTHLMHNASDNEPFALRILGSSSSSWYGNSKSVLI